MVWKVTQYVIQKGGPGSGSWNAPGDPRFDWTPVSQKEVEKKVSVKFAKDKEKAERTMSLVKQKIFERLTPYEVSKVRKIYVADNEKVEVAGKTINRIPERGGLSVARNKTIYIDEDCINEGTWWVEHVVCHEIGHQVAKNILKLEIPVYYTIRETTWDKWKKVWKEERVTAYAKTSEKEGFAEAFALWKINPKNLEENFPETYNFMQTVYKKKLDKKARKEEEFLIKSASEEEKLPEKLPVMLGEEVEDGVWITYIKKWVKKGEKGYDETLRDIKMFGGLKGGENKGI